MKQIGLYITTLLPFPFGAISLKEKFNTRISNKFNQFKFKKTIELFGIFILIITQGLVPNCIVAPFIGVPFVFLWNQIGLATNFETYFCG